MRSIKNIFFEVNKYRQQIKHPQALTIPTNPQRKILRNFSLWVGVGGAQVFCDRGIVELAFSCITEFVGSVFAIAMSRRRLPPCKH